MRIVSLIFIAIMSITVLTVSPDKAHAQIAPYSDYDFNVVNLYTNNILIYFFEGMTEDDNFLVFLERLNDDGEYVDSIQARVVIADASGEANISWSETQETWDSDDQYPMRVVDDFGNILGYHFLSPEPDDSWGTLIGDGDEPDKLCIGGCIYNAETGNSNHHESSLSVADQNKILTFENDYTLMHYRCDHTNQDADDKVQVSNIESGTVVFEAMVSELIEYNAPDDSFGDGYACNTFVVLSTNGEQPPFINEDQDSDASWSLDNPHTADFPVAGYSYARVDDGMGDAVIREGMSVWGVTSKADREHWTVESRNAEITADDQNRAIRRAKDENLFNAFPEMELTDSALGIIDGADHSFFTFRQDYYDVSPIPSNNVVLAWTLEADDLHYGQTTSEYQLEATSIYDVVGVPAQPSRGELLREVQAENGLDTDVGSLALFLVLGLALFIFMAWIGARKPQVFALAYIALSGMFILTLNTTTFSAFIIGISAIVVGITVFLSRGDTARA